MSEEPDIRVSPEIYHGPFVRAMDGHIADLKAILRSLEDGSFIERATTPSPGALLKLSIDRNSTPEKDAVQRACGNCFRAIISDFLGFIDRIIAFNQVLNRGSIRVDEPVISKDEVLGLIRNALDDEYRHVARDTSLKNPAKIERVLRTKDGVRIAKSLVSVRNCLEHRGGVPEKNTDFVYRRLTLSTGGVEVKSFPAEVVDEKMTLDLRVENRTFEGGKKIELTEVDIDNVAWTVRFLATEIVEVELKGG
jgi:hypothetical protein